MTAITFALFGALTKEQQLRAFEIWHDPTEPDQFTYCLQGDQVVGRAAINGRDLSSEFNHRPAPMVPDAVSSSRVDPKPISTRDVLHELPQAMRPATAPRRQAKPKSKPRRRSPYTRADLLRGLFWMAVLATAYIALH